jgi:hypothetical protein
VEVEVSLLAETQLGAHPGLWPDKIQVPLHTHKKLFLYNPGVNRNQIDLGLVK